ncbi:hypothetical protein M422DRAFT_140290, partial [Sphaerobolus stellatus SS14]
YVEESLKQDEIDLICGIYKLDIGDGNRNRELSWWPRPNAWKKSGLDVGYWSTGCERWYQERLVRISKNEATLKTSNEWK